MRPAWTSLLLILCRVRREVLGAVGPIYLPPDEEAPAGCCAFGAEPAAEGR